MLEFASEFLIGATIFVDGESKGTSSNVYGFYSITLKAGESNVKYSYIGYNCNNKKINLTRDTRLNIDLKEAGDLLEEVIIDALSDDNTTGTQMGKIDL